MPSDGGTAPVLLTARLSLRRLAAADAPFMLELLNDPSFLRFIGDRGVRTQEQAVAYIEERMVPSYDRHGYGLYLVEALDGSGPVGLAGLVRRPELDDADLGYAFLPPARGQGYAFEAAAAVMDYARNIVGLPRVLAIADTENHRSVRVLDKLGFVFDRMIRMAPDQAEIRLFVSSQAGRRVGG